MQSLSQFNHSNPGMKLIYTAAALIISTFCIIQVAQAQPVKYTTAINSAGGTANIGGNNYEWSIGEMALVNTGNGSNIIVTQGVLQPAQASGGVTDAPINNHISVFPVPSKSIVHLQYDFPSAGNLHYELMDITGKSLLKNNLVTDGRKDKQTIDLERFANGSYMLHVNFTDAGGNQSASSFKVEKIN